MTEKEVDDVRLYLNTIQYHLSNVTSCVESIEEIVQLDWDYFQRVKKAREKAQ